MNAEQAKRLAEPLDAARVKTRQAGGNRPALAYLETHDVIRTANEIFGFGQWGHEIVDLTPIPGIAVQGKEGKTGVCVGYVCTVRLTVEGCVPTSGIGYGDATEYQASGPVTAHELAVKEAESDALKRALKNYGDQFGLALYDKAARTSGHVATKPVAAAAAGTPKAGPAAEEAPGPAAPSDEELEALFAIIEQKGGDVAAERSAFETARTQGKLAERYAGAMAWYPNQPDSFANKVPKQKAAA